MAAAIPQIDSVVQKRYMELVANFFKSAFDARNVGKKVVWMAYFLPSELCYTLDAVPFYPEIYGGVCARMGTVLKCIEAAESSAILESRAPQRSPPPGSRSQGRRRRPTPS